MVKPTGWSVTGPGGSVFRMYRDYASAAGQRRVEALRQQDSAVQEGKGLPVRQVSEQQVLSRALAMTLPAAEVSHPADPDEQEAERAADALSGDGLRYHESAMRGRRSDGGVGGYRLQRCG
jgi:hypothetical protein